MQCDESFQYFSAVGRKLVVLPVGSSLRRRLTAYRDKSCVFETTECPVETLICDAKDTVGDVGHKNGNFLGVFFAVKDSNEHP